MEGMGSKCRRGLEEKLDMAKNLYNLLERIASTVPEALNTWRAQTSEGFMDVSEKLLEAAIVHLEQQGKNLKGSKEDNITSSAIGFFNRYGIRASSQTNSRGHVDIFIEHSYQPSLKVCGEAKIWRGTSYHIKGLRQVLGYCQGRLPYCFVLEYVTNGIISNSVSKLRKKLDVDLPEDQQGPATDHESMQWTLVTIHLHSSGEKLKVIHAAANLSK